MEVVESQLSCFVISPIGNKNAEIGTPAREIWENSIQTWEEVIHPACLGVGLTAIRADQINEVGEITDQIFRYLRDSHVVIADLTGANPNVMYELGLRHTTGRLTLQIGEIDRLPFDITTIRTIMFKRTPGGLILARRSLAEALAAGIEGRFSQISATRVWLEAASVEAFAEENVSDAITDEPGFLEMLEDMDSGRADMAATMSALGNVIGEIGAFTREATLALENAGGGAATYAERILISNKLAEKISDPAGRIEILTKSLVDSIEKSDPGTKYQIKALSAESSEAGDATLQTLKKLFLSILEGFSTTENYRNSLAGPIPTRAQGIQNRRIVTALDKQLSLRAVVENWIRLIDESVSRE